MADKLVIVESPAKANTIGKFLGKGYKIVASVGHVRDLPKSQMGVDIENDFAPKYITIRGKGEIISKLKKEAKNANTIYLATDPDREGEAISWHLANLLNIDQKEKCRVTFNEITKNAVKNAIKSPREINMDLVDAQQARRVLDRIVGYKISPLLWKKVKKGLSAGRVQSVATRLICDREEEIEKFVPEEYWTITAKLLKEGVKTSFDAKFYGLGNKKSELTSEEEVKKILDDIKDAVFVAQKVKKGEKKKNPNAPFTTSTMQQEASRKLGFSTKKTMIVAQQLYEGIEVKGVGAVGLVTYIRTDSTRVSEEAQNQAAEYIKEKFGESYLPKERNIYKNKSASQDAHECIRPTSVEMDPESVKESLSKEQYRLYKLIWDRFVASQMAPAVYDTINADIEAGKYLFKASGSTVKFPGFTVLYQEGKDEESEEGEIIIPELTEGENLKQKKIEPKQHFTQPPPRYTEASLVKALEEKGIGRPSTYAPTITTILARGYIVKEGKTLIPTELGKIVTDIMKNYFQDIVDVEFTAQMEKKLDEVEEGEKKWVDVMKNFYSQFVNVLKDAEEKIGNIEIPDEVTNEICEKCGRNMVIKMGKNGRFLACPGFPECRNAKPILEDAGVTCPKCGGKVYIKKTRKGRKYLGCENNNGDPKCDFMTWDMPSKESCPNCGSFLLKKYSGKKVQLRCSNENCDFAKTDGKQEEEE
ncbi:type I DNA topoisomerase [Acetivibrio straminisolvens]|jgi:DNA topoisomerase-1|uniref:DNA topoisomerase 1 n=1 Tax=Acetivibrio straminisolvens JCM 21531 TaxID=1294263 RepID=W4V885_9FIRM|nr:type I DNA topoisomerase [Acetivibrio straminisolvens]GAE88949.1 DNA topoisomerase I [Acetivibrio straminisolvens JCM 21531]